MPNTEIKLIATDLDGTLLRDDHLTLSPANREALTRAADAGIEVVAVLPPLRRRCWSCLFCGTLLPATAA